MASSTPKKLPLNLASIMVIDESIPQGLRWISGKHCGLPVGWIDKKKYYRFECSEGSFFNHRAIWILAYGEDPGCLFVDHIDKIKTNNTLSNLRLVNDIKNCQNRGRRKDNKSGVTGVRYRAEVKKWLAFITVNKVMLRLGYHSCFGKAISIRREAERANFGEYSPNA